MSSGVDGSYGGDDYSSDDSHHRRGGGRRRRLKRLLSRQPSSRRDGALRVFCCPCFSALVWFNQLFIMLHKQFLLSIRQKRSVCIRFLAPVALIFMLFMIDFVIQNGPCDEDCSFQEVRSFSRDRVKGIPRCIKGLDQDDCYTFLYAPEGDPLVEEIVELIRTTNQPSIPAGEVLGFPDADSIDDFMRENQNVSQAAILFDQSSTDNQVSYIIQYNTTNTEDYGVTVSSVTRVAMPLARATFVSTLSTILNETIELTLGTVKYPQKSYNEFDLFSTSGALFIFGALMFTFVVCVQQLVSERESGVRLMMKTSGLWDSAYWTSWFLSQTFFSTVAVVLVIATGAACQFPMFLKSDFAVYFPLFWLFSISLIPLAFLISTLVRKAQNAVLIGFMFFLAGFLLYLVAVFVYADTDNTTRRVFAVIFSFISPLPFTRGVIDISGQSANTDDNGVKFEDIIDPSYETGLALYEIYIILVVDTLVYLLAALYLDNVLPYERGVRQPLYYPLSPSYWWGSEIRWSRIILGCCGLVRRGGDDGQARRYGRLNEQPRDMDDDVFREENDTRTLADERAVVHVQGLKKRFGGKRNGGLCSACKIPFLLDCWADAVEACVRGILCFPADVYYWSLPRAAKKRIGGVASSTKTAASSILPARRQPRRRRGRYQSEEEEGHGAADDDDDDDELQNTPFGWFVCVVSAIVVAPLKCLRFFALCNCCPGRCCGTRKKAFTAVNRIWFSIEEDTLFCLLGPNGAGKSTTINILTGLLSPTEGTAHIFGHSIRTEMKTIQGMMGVCPQFDVLWDELTGEEHLWIYAGIKGFISPWARGAEVERRLRDVNLAYARDLSSRSYSGGMRRRLSVAMALIGDPKIVFLDEPTTGMDPVSRKQVWDMIEEAKRGRVVILTTHSMEEADILGDKIAILAQGRLRCIGSSLRLKNKFGAGYTITVHYRCANDDPHQQGGEEDEATAAINEFFHSRLARVETDIISPGIASYNVPRDLSASLPAFFEELEAMNDQLHIENVQISMTTLEEVFLKIAEAAEREAIEERGIDELNDNAALILEKSDDAREEKRNSSFKGSLSGRKSSLKNLAKKKAS